MNVLTKAADALAEVIADNCSASPEGDWTDCCRAHDDGPYTTAPRWRLDLKLIADVQLGWCIATRTPAPQYAAWWARAPYHVAHVAVGALYTAAVSTFGLVWWFKSIPPEKAAMRWAKGRVLKSIIRKQNERMGR